MGREEMCVRRERGVCRETESSVERKTARHTRSPKLSSTLEGGLRTIVLAKIVRFLCVCGETFKLFFIDLLVH